MSDVDPFSDTLGYKLLEYFVLSFLAGFIPGFYLAYQFFAKFVKKLKPYFILFYFIGGLVFGYLSIPIIEAFGTTFQSSNTQWNFFADGLPYLILLEILLLLIHFFYFRKRTKKKKV